MNNEQFEDKWQYLIGEVRNIDFACRGSLNLEQTVQQFYKAARQYNCTGPKLKGIFVRLLENSGLENQTANQIVKEISAKGEDLFTNEDAFNTPPTLLTVVLVCLTTFLIALANPFFLPWILNFLAWIVMTILVNAMCLLLMFSNIATDTTKAKKTIQTITNSIRSRILLN